MTYKEKNKMIVSSLLIDKEDYFENRMTKKQVDEMMRKREEKRARNKFVENLIQARKKLGGKENVYKI